MREAAEAAEAAEARAAEMPEAHSALAASGGAAPEPGPLTAQPRGAPLPVGHQGHFPAGRAARADPLHRDPTRHWPRREAGRMDRLPPLVAMGRQAPLPLEAVPQAREFRMPGRQGPMLQRIPEPGFRAAGSQDPVLRRRGYPRAGRPIFWPDMPQAAAHTAFRPPARPGTLCGNS